MTSTYQGEQGTVNREQDKPPLVNRRDNNKQQQERVKQVYQLLWEAENQGITAYKDLVNYIYDKTGQKISNNTIQRYKIDRNAQLKACGILLAEKQLITQYLDNPKLLYPELLIKIKALKPNKLTTRYINIISWIIAIIIVIIGYLGYNHYRQKPTQDVVFLDTKLSLNNDYTTSILRDINKPSSLVSGYLFIDDIEIINKEISKIKGVIIDEEKQLINFDDVPINYLLQFLEGSYSKGQLVVKEKGE